MARTALSIGVAAALLAGCGAAQSRRAPGAIEYGSRSAAPSSGDLLYVGTGSRAIEVFSYPDLSYKETFDMPSGGAAQLCSDSQGYVFAATLFTGSPNQAYIYEYAHGGTTPIETLDLPIYYVAVGCSVDPTTGNLAVTEYSTSSGAADVAVYPNAQGTPAKYTDQEIVAGTQPGYDDRGNLFLTSGGSVVAELPVGGGTIGHAALSKSIGLVKRIQWDGSYLAVQGRSTKREKQSELPELIYQVQVSGSIATVANVVKLRGWKARYAGQSWIEGGRVVAPTRNLSLWKYPSGGNTIKHVGLDGNQKPVSVTVSVGSKRNVQ